VPLDDAHYRDCFLTGRFPAGRFRPGRLATGAFFAGVFFAGAFRARAAFGFLAFVGALALVGLFGGFSSTRAAKSGRATAPLSVTR